MTTLVTGFDAFADVTINPSQRLVEALEGAGYAGVITSILRTAYRAADERMRELIQTHRPEDVLMFGCDQDARAIRLELAALNLDDCTTSDNDGEVRNRQRIAEDAPVGYWSTLPLDRMADVARSMGQPVEFSRDAGGFVCNHVFFTASHTLAREWPGSRCGFIHLPPMDVSSAQFANVLDLVETWIVEVCSSTRRV